MVGFAKSRRVLAVRRPARGARRLAALAITTVIHLIALGLIAWGGFRPHPPVATRDIVAVVLTARNPAAPVEPEKSERREFLEPKHKATMPSKHALTLPAVKGPETGVPPPALGIPEIATLLAAAPVPAVPAAHRSKTDIADDYRQLLFARLAAQRHYPEAARLRRYQGDGAVLFRIDRDGRLLAASMERSTGKTVLDRAALTQVRRAAPFPQIPAELPDELAVSMPLQFLITEPARRVAAR